ncbi:ComEC/Rec2 family competence protein [Patescibacteria group bacterium]|nr:ComEC/Rec2 family competence protein [Patescibacteria group bacterium]
MDKSKIFYFCFCFVFLILGIWRYQVLELRIKNYELRKYNDSEEEITLIGAVVKEPDVRENNIKLTIQVDRGKILATVGRYPEYKYGDELKITGKLQTPPIFEDFNYKNYLVKDGIYSVVYYPKVELLSREEYKNFISASYAGILFFKDKLRQGVYSSLSPPKSSILGAMLLGDKNRMSQDLKEKLNIAGVRHITAVSGMHVVILSGILMSLLLWLGFWRGQAFYISIIIIFLFIAMTGFQASGVRAGIMGGLFLLGQKIGRKSVSSRAIVMAAGIMLVINPLLLLNDVGFQLSFLAAMGIIYLSSTFRRWLRFIPQKLVRLKEIIAMTFAAQIFTLPILVYNFGRISLVAPLTNVLILPFVYWIMTFGFIFGLAGILWQPLGMILSLPCWFLLTYLTKIVDFFSRAGWAAKTFENVHWLWLIISYLILGFLAWRLNKREKLKFLNY